MSRSTPSERLRVVLASDLSLVEEAVRAGLADHGFETITSPRADPQSGGILGPARHSGYDVGLLINDLDNWSRLRAALLVISGATLPWVVLTAAPRGPIWGAVLNAGAHVVLPSSTGLKTVSKVVVQAARGSVETPAAERELLIEMWIEWLDQRELIGQRIRSLTPREHEVLTMLYAG